MYFGKSTFGMKKNKIDYLIIYWLLLSIFRLVDFNIVYVLKFFFCREVLTIRSNQTFQFSLFFIFRRSIFFF